MNLSVVAQIKPQSTGYTGHTICLNSGRFLFPSLQMPVGQLCRGLTREVNRGGKVRRKVWPKSNNGFWKNDRVGLATIEAKLFSMLMREKKVVASR